MRVAGLGLRVYGGRTVPVEGGRCLNATKLFGPLLAVAPEFV